MTFQLEIDDESTRMMIEVVVDGETTAEIVEEETKEKHGVMGLAAIMMQWYKR